MLITSFGDGAGSKLKAVKQLPFEVTVNRVVTRRQLSSCRTELTLAGQAKQLLRKPSKQVPRQP